MATLLVATFGVKIAPQKETAGKARPFLRKEGRRLVLLDDDLDAAVLRLAHVVAGRHQSWLSPLPMTVIAWAGTPSRTRASLTALARRSDSAML